MSAADSFDLEHVEELRSLSAMQVNRRLLRWQRLRLFNLQWGHRAGSAALFALLVAIGCAIANLGPYGLYFAAAAILADIGLMGAFLAWWTIRRLGQMRGEAIGLIVFNFVILLLSVAGYAAAQTQNLQYAVQWIISLFPPAH